MACAAPPVPVPSSGNCPANTRTPHPLTPAKAGVQGNGTLAQLFGPWIPAYAGMSGN
jgi:hypothetical protein